MLPMRQFLTEPDPVSVMRTCVIALRSVGKPVKLALVSAMLVVTSPASPVLVQVAFVHVALPVMPPMRG
jgi:hypothetical protein